MSLPANRRRIEHLKYARLHAAGVFDSIIITEPPGGAEQIAAREIGPRRLVELDETTGRFRAERLSA